MNLAAVFGLVAALATGLPGFAGTPDPIGAIATLSADRTEHSAADPVIVQLTLSNPHRVPLRILADQLPGEELTAPLFQISVDGVPVPYLGMLAHRAHPTPRDYRTLAAGERLRLTVDLTRHYSFARTGDYEIRYRAQSQELYAPDGHSPPAGRLQSNALTLRVAGRADKALPMAVPDVVSGPNTFTACSVERQQVLTTARMEASVLANEAAAYFAADRHGARYLTWFGSYIPYRWHIVRAHFELIREAIDTATIDFDCNCTVQNPDRFFAYVFPPRAFRIHLCNLYWLASTNGVNSRATILIHEMSHFTVLGGTLDFAYTQVGSATLAVQDPDNAILNADSHAYFAENRPPTADDGGAPLSIAVLANGIPVTGLGGEAGTELRYAIDVPVDATDLRIQARAGSGDPNLYVRLGDLPTRVANDCKSESSEIIDECLLARPDAGRHHILVVGRAPFTGLTLTASFTRGIPTLRAATAGLGSGVVSSQPAGIHCGSACTRQFADGGSVTLTATADAASSFSGWSGDCAGTRPSCTLTLDASRQATAVFSRGAAGAALDEPAWTGFALPSPDPAHPNCPAGFFVATAADGPGAGLVTGTFGMEVLLDAPGTRLLAGGLNFGGLIDAGQAGFAGFNIANPANEPQVLQLSLSGSPASDAQGRLPVRVRIVRLPDASTQQTVFETSASIALAAPFQTELPLPPGFYAVTVAPASGTAGGAAEGQFYFSMATRFVDRPGGGFQGGAVVGGYHAAHPFGGVSGFAAFCLGTTHRSSVRLLSQPSYGSAGARDLRLRLLDAQQRELVVVPGD